MIDLTVCTCMFGIILIHTLNDTYCVMNVEFRTSFHASLQYHLPMPISLLRADNNLPPWRPGLKEVIALCLFNYCFFSFLSLQ